MISNQALSRLILLQLEQNDHQFYFVPAFLFFIQAIHNAMCTCNYHFTLNLRSRRKIIGIGGSQDSKSFLNHKTKIFMALLSYEFKCLIGQTKEVQIVQRRRTKFCTSSPEVDCSIIAIGSIRIQKSLYRLIFCTTFCTSSTEGIGSI